MVEIETMPSEELPGQEESSSTSSGTASHVDPDEEDEHHHHHLSTPTMMTTMNNNSNSNSNIHTTDPYADVRERMEELAARDKSRFANSHSGGFHDDMTPPAFMAIATYLGYAVQIFCGHVRDICARIFGRGRYIRTTLAFPSDNTALYPPLLKSFDDFFTRRIYHRIQDCFNRVLASNPGAHIEVLERVSSNGNKSLNLLGNLDNLDNEEQKELYLKSPHIAMTADGRAVRKCINLGSYNYLGFADDWMTTCAPEVLASLEDHPVSSSSCRAEFGTTVLHKELESVIANFTGKEDALVYNMGFNTNATTIPALVGRGDLLISDALNHTSIINGARASGAAIRVFRHNDTKHLEETIREAIIFGRPRTRRPWNKILVLVEGIYSMEGEYCDLPNVVKVCKKYGAYIYLDEAHSIGAMGPSGRGCAEYTGVDTADIDIMMGTFTKSFGGMGGYIAASKDVIEMLRQKCAGSAYHNSLSPVVCQQVITSLKVCYAARYVDGTS